MWNEVFKFLCWMGWHLWEYIYAENNSAPGERQCKRCSAKQVHSDTGWGDI